METIDADWIKQRLSGARGEKTRLAEAMGVDTHVVSKIINGTRQVHITEAPKIVRFFEDQAPQPATAKQRLSQAISEVSEQEARLLLGVLDATRAQGREEGE